MVTRNKTKNTRNSVVTAVYCPVGEKSRLEMLSSNNS